MSTRTVNWGEGILVELFKTEGGLRAVVNAIHDEIGETTGNRNTFARLLRIEDPASLSEKDQWRSWLLLTALRQNPEDWGISNDVVPRSFDPDLVATRLQELVHPKDANATRSSRCSSAGQRLGRVPDFAFRELAAVS